MELVQDFIGFFASRTNSPNSSLYSMSKLVNNSSFTSTYRLLLQRFSYFVPNCLSSALSIQWEEKHRNFWTHGHWSFFVLDIRLRRVSATIQLWYMLRVELTGYYYFQPDLCLPCRWLVLDYTRECFFYLMPTLLWLVRADSMWQRSIYCRTIF